MECEHCTQPSYVFVVEPEPAAVNWHCPRCNKPTRLEKPSLMQLDEQPYGSLAGWID
jgi:hypothetical protein